MATIFMDAKWKRGECKLYLKLVARPFLPGLSVRIIPKIIQQGLSINHKKKIQTSRERVRGKLLALAEEKVTWISGETLIKTWFWGDEDGCGNQSGRKYTPNWEKKGLVIIQNRTIILGFFFLLLCRILIMQSWSMVYLFVDFVWLIIIFNKNKIFVELIKFKFET